MADNTKQNAQQSFFVFVRDAHTGKIRRVAIPSDLQVGLQGNPAELQLLGRLSLSSTTYEASAANRGIVNVKSSDTIVSITRASEPPSGRITVYLPTNNRDGQLHFIKDVTGTANDTPLDVSSQVGALIDLSPTKTIDSAFGSLALYWQGNGWYTLLSGSTGAASSITTSSSGADVSASYVTISNTGSLPNERALTAGSGITLTDSGPGGTITIAAVDPAAIPIFTMPILAGTVTTNTAHTGSKLSIGATYYNSTIISTLPGSKRIYWRAIADVLSTEPNMSASVDLYDINGIVAYPPAIITNSTMSSSNPTMTQLEVELTSLLSAVTGSGIFEARLWRTVSGSLTSSVTCRNARIEVEAVSPAVPLFGIPILAGTVTTNIAHTGSKQTLGAAFFDPSLINAFAGSRTYWWRAIIDMTSTEPNMSASVDLYDINGITAYPPGIVVNSMLSSSSPTMTQVEANLTTLLSAVTGSGIFEARLWRTISGSLTSSAACRNARIEVEFS